MTHYTNLDCADKGPVMSPDEILSLAISDVARSASETGEAAGDAIMAELRSRGRLLPADPAKERRPLLDIFRDAMAWGRAYAQAIPARQWDEIRDSKAAQYIAEVGAPPQQEGEPRYCPLIGIAAEPLAIAVLRLVDRHILDSRSPAADALMSWADMRFNVVDGTGIAKLRTLAETLP